MKHSMEQIEVTIFSKKRKVIVYMIMGLGFGLGVGYASAKLTTWLMNLH